MTDEAKALVERLRGGWNGWTTLTEIEAADLIETQAREAAAKDSEIERLKAKVDGLRDLLVRGYVVCDGDDEDAVAFRNDAHAALAGDTQ